MECGREKCPKFHTVEKKLKANSRNSALKHSAEEKTTRNNFSGTKIEANSRNFVPKHFAEKTHS
jgi:hypothetical protein